MPTNIKQAEQEPKSLGKRRHCYELSDDVLMLSVMTILGKNRNSLDASLL